MSGEFSGKVVLVTGAGKGTGRRLAEAFAAAGARVAVNDLTPVNLDETMRRIAAAGGQARAYVQDVTKKMPVQALVSAVMEDLGGLDILVCSAEVEPVKSLLDMDDWDWQRTLDVNVSGVFLLIQAAARGMAARNQGGTILLMGARPKGSEKRAAYFASKAALERLAELAGQELAAWGIRVCHVRTAEEALEACRP